jgi:hypothetical protein
MATAAPVLTARLSMELKRAAMSLALFSSASLQH